MIQPSEFLMASKPSVEVTSTVTVKIKDVELQLTLAEARELVDSINRAIGTVAPAPSLYPHRTNFLIGQQPQIAQPPRTGDWIPNPYPVTC